MNIADTYRSSSDFKEILRILQKSSTEMDNFLWQTTAAGKNIIHPTHYEIDFVGREVVVHYDQSKYRLQEKLPLYMKLDYRGAVFKVTGFYIGQSSLRFSFPEFMKAEELRSIPRHGFEQGKERVISLRPSLSNAARDTSNELQVRAIDISPTGLGLIISEHNRSFLKFNRILWLTKLADKDLEFPILAEVVYMNSDVESRARKKVKELKVGLKLSGSVPAEALAKFIQ
jgi:hypothetical protein